MKKILFFSMLPLLLTAGSNQLTNGSFENETSRDYWLRSFRYDKESKKFIEPPPETASIRRESGFAADGNSALKIVSAERGWCGETNGRAFLDIAPGKEYCFEMSVFPAGGTIATGRIQFFKADRKTIAGYSFFEFGSGTPGKWNRFKHRFIAPKEAAYARPTVWINGAGTAYLDDFFFGAPPLSPENRKTPTARKLSEAGGALFWSEPGWKKCDPAAKPEAFRSGGEIELDLARNEAESFQLIWNSPVARSNVKPEFSGLKSDSGAVLPAASFDWYETGFIEMKHPDKTSLKGFHADPLLKVKSSTAKPGKNLIFFIRCKAPAGQKAGIYRGTVALTENGKTFAEAPLKIQVRDFELPARPALKSWFLFFFRPPYLALDGRSKPEILDDLHRLYRMHGIRGNQGSEHLPAPKCEVKDGKLRITEWKSFDAEVEKQNKEYGFDLFPIPGLRMRGDYFGWFTADRQPGDTPWAKVPELSPEGLRLTGDYAREFMAHVNRKFPNFTFYSYLYDEPPERIRPQVKKLTDAIHAAAPDLKIFIPMEVDHRVGPVHTWCVPFGEYYLNPARERAERAAGKEIWYYNWSVRIDTENYLRNRLFAWQIFANDGTGGLLWHVCDIPKGGNPWTALEKTHDYGAATIFYPPRKPGEKISPSLRSMQIADGIEEFGLLTLLRDRIDRSFPGYGTERVKELMRSLLPDLRFEYVNDFDRLYELRKRLADELENFDLPFPALLLSTPPEGSRSVLNTVELRLFAPPGTEAAGFGKTGPQGELRFSAPLDAKGKVTIRLRKDGAEKTITRTYLRCEDQTLAELRKIASGFPEAETFLAAFDRNGRYGENERQTVARLLGKIKENQLRKACAALSAKVDPLRKHYAQQAEKFLKKGNFDQAAFYLEQRKMLDRAGDRSGAKVTIAPAKFGEYDGIRISNGTLDAVILECGGRIVSFKIDGKETLAQGAIAGVSEEDRIAGKVSRADLPKLRNSAGIEDASGIELLPESFANWQLAFREVSPGKVTVGATSPLIRGMFRIIRSMTVSADSPDLRLDYAIVNTLPESYASDNPEHYEFPWRLRILPAIGENKLDGDILYLPGADLPATSLDRLRIRYEAPSVPLRGNRVGVYDPREGVGLEILFDPAVIQRAYVWFDTWERMLKLCTLEFPRRHDKASPERAENHPFSIPPGRTELFSITLRGRSGIRSESDFGNPSRDK